MPEEVNLADTRGSAQAPILSIRDLRVRPLRAVVQAPKAEPEQSPLEAALLKYLDEQPQRLF